MLTQIAASRKSVPEKVSPAFSQDGDTDGVVEIAEDAQGNRDVEFFFDSGLSLAVGHAREQPFGELGLLGLGEV